MTQDNPRARSSVDYALRTAQQNTLHLSAMADQKASIVLGSSFLILSIIFTDIDLADPDFAVLALATTALASGLLATLALIPRMPTRTRRSTYPNLLFFGTVARMDHNEYMTAMRDVIADDSRLYDAILEDLYQSSFAPQPQVCAAALELSRSHGGHGLEPGLGCGCLNRAVFAHGFRRSRCPWSRTRYGSSGPVGRR